MTGLQSGEYWRKRAAATRARIRNAWHRNTTVNLRKVAEERSRNMQLLSERSWFDMPMVYNNKRRAILAIEKGSAGADAFESAFSAWGQLALPAESKPAPTPPITTLTPRSSVVFPTGISPNYSSQEPGQLRGVQ